MNLSMEELLSLEITTAARRTQRVSEAPAAVTVITRAELRRYGYRTLAQALASVPGFYTTNDRGYTYLGVRGAGIPTDYNIRVLLLLNGLPLNDKYYGTAVAELTPDLLDSVERIEIVKGPSSTLYGSNALFATVNVITRSGADVDGAVVSAEAGSGPLGRGVLSYGDRYSNGLDLFVSGHYEASEGDNHISFGADGEASGADDHHVVNGYVSAAYGDFLAQLWYAEREKEIPTGQFGTIIGDERTTTADQWYLGELRWERELADDKAVMLRGYYQKYPYRGVYAADDPDFALTVESTMDEWLGYEAQFDWQPLARHELTFGGIYEHHWTQLRGHSDDAAGATSFIYPGTSDAFSYWGVYAQDEIRLLDSLTLTAGVRYDDYPDFAVDRVSPRGALVWSAGRETTFKLLYGQAFRAPSNYERTYAAGTGDAAVNETLEPETIRTYELIVEQQLPYSMFGRLSVFHNDVRDLIVQADDDILVFDNALDLDTTGVEAELIKKFASGVRAFVNATWQDSDFSDGPALNSPEWIANVGLNVPVIGDKLAIAVRENYVSERPTRILGDETDDAFLTDLTLTSEDVLPGWSLNLSLLNLFDEDYSVPSGTDGTVDEIPQRGRTVLFRTSYEF